MLQKIFHISNLPFFPFLSIRKKIVKLRDVKMIRERSEKSTEKFVNLKVEKKPKNLR